MQENIIIFKTVNSFSKELIEEEQKMQKSSIWDNLIPKIKQETLCNSLKESDLRNVKIHSNGHGLNDYITSLMNGN